MEFIREIGVHFTVNRMIAAECYKQRMERGLTFLEFNYMIMQAYDFLQLYRNHNCILQMGGDDQWSNMLAGADLIRRVERVPAFACTFNLLMNAEGQKMGKTEKGALWLDAEMCSPYEFFQYWRNIADADVKKTLSMLTFLPMEEVNPLKRPEGFWNQRGKTVLAFETTKLVHGQEEAEKAREVSAAPRFAGGGSLEDVPALVISAGELQRDNRLTTILFLCGLCAQPQRCPQNGAARGGNGGG